ncbi:hypothetical protein [Mycobacterium sp. 1465703.0]|uniref:hypothetical protein n=1 Tax=Mycobacterium sp. 1465703.0 TaxID=1834078 RepID=UPI0007FFD568|nr:hypothetical protein [Mycobacterium sp. 1465703.0]OBJ10741.1 hypothetical protein A5625_10840 [Mycobacterium sp. 1465703.0]
MSAQRTPRDRIAAAGVVAAFLLTGGCAAMNHQTHHDCKVTGKDMLYDTSGDKHGTSTKRTKRLSTTCGVFNVSDNVVGGFNSFDTWSQLEVGHVYDIETGGYRIGFFGEFPTVTKVTPK